MTLRNGTSGDRIFDSDFQAINETHRPTTSPQAGIVRIDRYQQGGSEAEVCSGSAIGQVDRI
ncbi:hypothetical protein EEB14_36770 [Rhodococcus sp. WS4]|nr:hypothetical protein EEB14_36770 [Rhodococcus sp. WS4]